ncbi:hypothetical protein [Acinetobacter modestus]|uniref:hypothetical protein n=1 Tax=Acinetobacter modestus TaxID=1776740 RepID=UPI00320A8A51
MNFNNIPDQLRTPLFFGEVSINGNTPVVSSNTEPNPPLISCEGATFRAHFLSSPDTYQKQWSVELDGISYDLAFDAILSDYYMPQEVLDVLKINGDGDWFIENRTSDIHRVRFIPDEDSLPVESPDIDLASNPTIHIDEETGIISFCLAASHGAIPAI